MRLIQELQEERLGVRGDVQIDILDARNLDRVLDTIFVRNKIVAVGRSYLGLMVKGSEPVPTDVAVGTDNTAPADGDTTLAAQVFKDEITQRLNILNGVRIRFLLPSSAANGSALKEAGILGPSPNLYLLSRVVYTTINKTSSIAVNYTWDISFTEA